MFPYFNLFGMEFSMTSLWIIVFLICYLLIAHSLCKKRHQDFYKLFYLLPVAIVITYILWAYVYFFLNNQWTIIPRTRESLIDMLNPYWYHFHFVWILLGIAISMIIFFSSIKRAENKRVWADILFFSITLSLIPLGVFLAFGDNFIWKASTSLLAVKPLTTHSELNKLGSVYPVWLFVSFAAMFTTLITVLIKNKKWKFGTGLIWFMILLLLINIIFMYYQQAPRYWVLAIWSITFDIKQYISFFVILLFVLFYYNRKNK